MRCIIGTHVSHLHIRIVFGSLYQIGFHFKALARRRKTIAQITSAIIINFLHGTLHLGSHHLHKRIGLCLTMAGSKLKSNSLILAKLPNRRFLTHY